MQLSRLRVKNIRSYESADVEFGTGTTLIAGDVGAGKTSLLYAIEMALFGVAEVNAAYLVRHGAGHAEVAVAFEGGTERYEIARKFRRLRRKGQEAFEAERIRFTVDGAETAYSATELRQKVIDLLGFPDNPSPQAHSDLWRWAVYVPQERMRDILGVRPAERLETVRKALGVERYRTAADNAQELASDLRRSAASRRAEAERLRHFDEEFEEGRAAADRLRVERGTVEHGLRDREGSVATARSECTELANRLRNAEADVREEESLAREQASDRATLAEQARHLRDREKDATRQRNELEELRADAEALEQQRSSLAEAERTLARLRKRQERQSAELRALAEARARQEAAKRTEAEARAAVTRARTEEEAARRALEEAQREGPAKEPPAPTSDSLVTIDERLALAREREAGQLQLLAHAESALAEVEELLRAGVCPRCQQPVRAAEYASHRAEATDAVDRARRELAATGRVRAHVDELRKSRERFERAFDRWKEAERRRSSVRTLHDRAESALREVLGHLEGAGNEAARASERVEELLPEEQREAELRGEMERAEATRAANAREVEKASLAAERRRGLERSLDAFGAETSRIGREVAQVEERVASRAARMALLEGSRKEVAAVRSFTVEADRRLRESEEQLARERAALARLEAQLEEADRRINAAGAGRRERADLLAEAADVEQKAAWLGTHFRDAVLEMEKKLLTHAQALFEREFARYFASLVDDPGLVARTDPAFTPLVMIEGEWTPAEALSGGERTSLALAFRLALARVVRSMGSLHLDTILLDEPTDGFSPEQVVRMGELLEELALPQVIVVSHESELAAIADRVVRVRKLEGRSVLEDARASDPPSGFLRAEEPPAAP